MINYFEPKHINTTQELKERVQLGITTESTYIDFKEEIALSFTTQKRKQEVAEELALDICQFANTWGGVLVVGVKESVSTQDGIKVAQEFSGVSNFDIVDRFISDSVIPLIYPKNIKLSIKCLLVPDSKQIIAINVFPLAIGVACVCLTVPPYTPKYPYRTHYGKKYLHPIDVEKRMSESNRSVPIKLEDLGTLTREVTLFPKIEKEPIDKPDKWESQDINVMLKTISQYDFSLRISGIDINIPFSLVRDVWFTEKGTIGLLLNTKLVVSADRKNVYLDL